MSDNKLKFSTAAYVAPVAEVFEMSNEGFLCESNTAGDPLYPDPERPFGCFKF